ncbi:MAG: 3-deoxy-8-phosphooctulonate synthase [Opitutales bacterium]
MFFDATKLLLLAGPCSLESRETCAPVAEKLAALREAEPRLNLVFKGSFDKANRTSLKGARGPGIDEGLELLRWVKRDYGLPVVTDIHLPMQAERAAEVCDVLQIPAFLCRQTDLLVAAAQTGRIVNVKKGQFLSPAEMAFVVHKLEGAGAQEVWQTERGTFFGYQNLVVDMRSFALMQAHGWPALFDATHSVQLPGAAGGHSGGQREFVPALAKAALAAGADGLFIETHPEPAKALSDGPSQVPLAEFAALVEECLRVWSAVRAVDGASE